MTASVVPAVLDALVARLVDRLAPLQVVDGPIGADHAEQDILIVGYPDAAGVAVESELTKQDGWGSPRYVERFGITCALSVWRGVATFTEMRAVAIGHLDALGAALREDRALGGVAETVGLGVDFRWIQGTTPDGPVVEVEFQVNGQALVP